MSDPVTNVEIEDVLSSIRRLVSEDARPRQVAAKPSPDRLVLTPSQRVPEPDMPGATETGATDGTGGEPRDPILLTDFAADPTPNMETAPEDGAGTSGTETETKTKTEEPAIEPAQSAEAEAEAGAENPADTEADPDTPEISARDTEADQATHDTSDPNQDALLARMVEQEVANALSDLPRDHDPLQESAEHAQTSNPTEEVARDHAAEDAAADQAKSPSLEQKVARLEAMIAGTEGDWENDPPASDGTAAFLQDAADALPWHDYHVGEDEEVKDDADTFEAGQTAAASDADHSVAAPLSPRADTPSKDDDSERDAPDAAGRTAAAPGTSDASDAFAVDDAPLIDEDMLRDMVAEIVRQELQGALGERITRNVRKLVRREIHRALLSQNLE